MTSDTALATFFAQRIKHSWEGQDIHELELQKCLHVKRRCAAESSSTYPFRVLMQKHLSLSSIPQQSPQHKEWMPLAVLFACTYPGVADS